MADDGKRVQPLRVERAIDAFLDWRKLERDATPRSVESYRRILWKLAEDYPEANLSSLATGDLRRFLARWGESSAATRSNVISVLHSFFGWAEAEDVIETDPSRKIRRPPKRKPDVYRPSLDELPAYARRRSHMNAPQFFSWRALAFAGPR
jgi:site-specific recombinase XerD